MNIFFVSDLHFGHKNVIEYSRRPFASVEHMNGQMISAWNKTVGKKDKIYILGDFAFMPKFKIQGLTAELHGKKHLILGNHDRAIRRNTSDFLSGELFHSIQDYLEFKIDGKLFCLLHFPMRSWHKSHKGSIHLHGHSHGEAESWRNALDVGVDCKAVTHEYRPIHLDEILAYFRMVDLIHNNI